MYGTTHSSGGEKKLVGVMAEFKSSDELLLAAKKAYGEGYRGLDAFSPMPVEGLIEAMGKKPTLLPKMIFAGAMIGMVLAFGLQYFVCVIDYPINIGGRPLNSWPMFLPITFELTILFAAFTAVFGMIGLNGLPLPYHPVFNVDAFKKASRDGFFLQIKSDDPKFDKAKTTSFLKGLSSVGVYDVED